MTLSDEDEDEDEHPAAMAPSTGVASFVPAMKEQGNTMPVQVGALKKKSKKKKRGGRGAKKPSKWADKCMYAELLEMVYPCVSPFDSGDQVLLGDGLPTDLETGWVAVGPVPVGKRCLAVTYQSSGVAGVGE
jgi:snurportin-1